MTDKLSYISSRPRGNYGVYLILILALAAVLRLGTYAVYRPWSPEVTRDVVLTTDAIWYHTLAENLALGNGYSIYRDFPYSPHLIVAPLFPCVIATLYKVFGIQPAVAVLYNALLGVANCFLFYLLLHTLTRNLRTALIGCLLFAIMPTCVVFSNSLVTEQSFTLFLLLSCISMVHLVRKPTLGRATLVAVCLGALNLVKFSALFIPAIFAIPFILFATRTTLLRRFGLCVYIGIVFYLFVFPWQLRNYVKSGNFVYTTNKQIQPLFFYMREFRVAQSRTNREAVIAHYVDLVRERTGTPFFPDTNSPAIWQMERYYKPADYAAATKLFIEEFRQQPVDYIVFHYSRLPNFLFTVPAHEWGRQLGFKESELNSVNNAIAGLDAPRLRRLLAANPTLVTFVIGFTGLGILLLLLVYIGSVVGIVRGFRMSREVKAMTLFWILFALFVVSAVGPLGRSRYRCPVMPGVIALSAIGWSSVFRRSRTVKG